MTPFKKIAAVALTSLTVLTAYASTAEAQYRRHGYRPAPAYGYGYRHRGNGWNRGGMVAAGLLGGALLGAAVAPRYYAAPAYSSDCYQEHVGYSRSGRPLYRTMCY